MTPTQMESFREWVRAEIEYALEGREEGSDGYRCSARRERDAAQRAFDKVCAALLCKPAVCECANCTTQLGE
jgi:predicted HNH restriction endonuclease